MNAWLTAALIFVFLTIAFSAAKSWDIAALCLLVMIVCGAVGVVQKHDSNIRYRHKVEVAVKRNFPRLRSVRIEEGGSLLSFRVGSKVAVTCEAEVKLAARGGVLVTALPSKQGAAPEVCVHALLVAD